MPVITLYYEDIETLIGTDKGTFIDRVPMIGADIERIEDDHIDIEFFPDRPDLYSPEGVARAMRGFLDIHTGLPEYNVKDSGIRITLDDGIKNIRPYLGCAVVKGLEFNDYSIESLMALQEDLHWGLGRDRKKVSIGIHDISDIEPPFRYVAADPDFSFVPLDFEEPMTMQEILKSHPKGVKYAHLMEGFNKYPLILDAKDQVLSFPPIINGQLTRVSHGTRDLFIDVTGLDRKVYTALNIVVTSLAERGGNIGTVTIENSIDNSIKDGIENKIGDNIENGIKNKIITPDLTPEHWNLGADEVKSLIGIDLTPRQIVEQLQRMRFGASIKEEGSIDVSSPAYRADILHTWDILEDISIGYGYDNIPLVIPKTVTVGRQHPISIRRNEILQIMPGLGYNQVMPFTLTSEKVHYDNMLRSPNQKATPLKHPISEDQTMVRTTILPNLMEILSLNQHRELPQRIFEVGDVVVNGITTQHLAAVSIHPASNFTEVRGVVDAVMRERGLEYTITGTDDPAFLKGRRAALMVDGNEIGTLGEIHPDVLTNFGLQQPTVGFELIV
ncbi:MAG: phenylalanine--tRNA ligase subunit beta [ANME-2 cluster archaeon]|nr:phenylalanine--tRNA ligase subunit beta [ANME-2 cluster archaeon]MBC2701832.1 phenylalanine--tRNA ligase subunit beta [ANME-2 cluster archaeon]MBC2706724.1 phenylalanine--tRNA ligase subunit beta [ANME-2 cluster archaeon]MBC2747954.1 phenylalanine--tRNA ligase subunit beta [ANME-2 cluster archaeon]MBC2763125.1 phenylalanine--tRNA ligase subunit beta [ANME-2 cluster archaeon]